MEPSSALPPGQRALAEFPRFGLFKFERRIPADTETIVLDLRGDLAQSFRIGAQLQQLERVEQQSDFHCVTGWSVRAQRWSGYRFRDFYHQLVVPQAQLQPDAEVVVLRGRDGYAASLPLADLLASEVLLADRLDDQPLGIAHGAPLRLLAPAHYGYKSVKHLAAIEFWRDQSHYRFPFPYPSIMDHPRARVALQERGRVLPAWLFRWIYRPLIGLTRWRFRSTLQKHLDARTPAQQRRDAL